MSLFPGQKTPVQIRNNNNNNNNNTNNNNNNNKTGWPETDKSHSTKLGFSF